MKRKATKARALRETTDAGKATKATPGIKPIEATNEAKKAGETGSKRFFSTIVWVVKRAGPGTNVNEDSDVTPSRIIFRINEAGEVRCGTTRAFVENRLAKDKPVHWGDAALNYANGVVSGTVPAAQGVPILVKIKRSGQLEICCTVGLGINEDQWIGQPP